MKFATSAIIAVSTLLACAAASPISTASTSESLIPNISSPKASDVCNQERGGQQNWLGCVPGINSHWLFTCDNSYPPNFYAFADCGDYFCKFNASVNYVPDCVPSLSNPVLI
ncbi:hypothetical protein BGZ60DRAFT_404558 [Tricladium varicosporioides]|nr:hypothetical protein BGZ60DRAFT_404558 [Hymenoscyphus varicosporioides]